MTEIETPINISGGNDLEDVVKAQQGKVTGIIIPPPDIRAVVDKTAQFVAKNGKNFENKILQSSEGKTAKFNFMKSHDPYHAYYEFKIREFEENINGGIDPTALQAVPPKPAPILTTTAPNSSQSTTSSAPPQNNVIAKASIASPFAKFAANKPTEPPPPFEFILAHPPALSALDVDIIKLTAQYTVVSGREFLGGLAQREQRNPQFDFLKPTHMLFSYFTSLVDAYAKILNPSPALRAKVADRKERVRALEFAVHRWDWIRAEEERKKRESAEADAERSAFQAIDWYDFSVAETITFGESELLEMPQLRLPGGVSRVDEDMDIEDHQQNQQQNRLPPPPPRSSGLPPPPPRPTIPQTHPHSLASDSSRDADMDMEEEEDPDIKVVSDYRPRVGGAGGRPGAGLTMIDPISGKTVPVSEMAEHMRIQLMDPKWREEQKRFQEKQQGTGYATGSSIASSLQSFAKQRGDIFGSTEDEEALLLEEREGRKRRAEDAQKIMWDGYQATAAATQAAAAQQAAKLPPAPTPIPISNIGPSMPSQLPNAPMSMPAISLAPRTNNSVVPPPAPPAAPTLPSYSAPPLHAAALPPVSLGVPPRPMPPLPVVPLPAAPLPLAGVPMMGIPPLGMGLGLGLGQAGSEYDQAVKRQKQEPGLVPESEFAAKYPGAFGVAVTLPNDTASNPALNGQMLHITLPSVLATVKELKEKISDLLGGLAGSKFQLKAPVIGFLKDTQSLAAANIAAGANLEFSLRSRGGKR